MKPSILAPFFLLTSVAVGRSIADDEGDPLPQTSRVTAFVIDDKGNPSVECWEFSNMINNMSIRRKDGSKSIAHSLTIAKGREIEGVDILTWPSYSPIWPDPSLYSLTDEVKPEWLDLSNSFNLFSIQGGLINFDLSPLRSGSTLNADEDSLSDHIFSLENGDDWFYFEDGYTGSDMANMADAAPTPMTISTVSATETEVLRLRFPKRPTYKVLHKGGCSFTGISTPAESSSKRKGRGHSLYKQQPLAVEL